MMKCIKFDREPRYIQDFIALYDQLYDRKTNMQNNSELRALLNGQHVLSKYFRLHKFCIYANGCIAGRFAFTEYPEDHSIYLGFFECVNDSEVAAFLFNKAEEFARHAGFQMIIGPVDGSFWLRYRLKINRFDRLPYTGEPYNQPYYLQLFQENGYQIAQHYTSSIYPRLTADFQNHKCANRYQRMVEQGYTFVQLGFDNWNETIHDVYRLITALYRDFPVYKGISEEDFTTYFAVYKQIINFDMVRMAYYQGQAVGFYISLPNYHNLVYHTRSVPDILRILWRRRHPREYVMLYMGVDPEHRGLGKALIQSIIDSLKTSGLPSIGALQRDGNITQTYVEKIIEGRYEYVLLCKELTAEPHVEPPAGRWPAPPMSNIIN